MASASGLSQTAIISIGSSIGGLIFLAASFVLVKIYLRRREYKRSVAEIEHGFEPTSTRGNETTEIGERVSVRRSILQPYDSPNGWNALSSSDQIHQIPPYAPSDGSGGVERLWTDGQPRKGFVIHSNRIRIGRISSKYRRAQPLSAIIESPWSLVKSPNTRSRQSFPSVHTVAGAQENRHVPNDTAVNIALHHRSDSPPLQIPPRSLLRPKKNTNLDLTGVFTLQDLDRVRTVRCKSIGTFLSPATDGSAFNEISKPDRPALHTRSLSFGAKASGPAPTGPLPPLPPRASLSTSMSQPAMFNPTVQDQIDNGDSMTGSQPDRNWERIVNQDAASEADRKRALDNTRRLLENPISDHRSEESLKTRRPGSLYSTALRNSARLSMHSHTSSRDSCSSIAASLNNDANRLSIPQIQTVDRVSMSRVSSSASLKSSNSIQVVRTPRRRPVSRVSIYGSPAERTKTSALKSISGNATTPPRHASVLRSSSSKADTDRMPFQWDTPLLPAKPSALKGSPGARNGHRRQNCVRISTLAPKVLGPRSRSVSPVPMDEIAEESPDGKRILGNPVTDIHINGDVTLRPQTSASYLNPTRLRASLTPSSPTLSMATFYHEQAVAGSESTSRRASYSPFAAKSSLSRDSSLFSIPSFPSPSHAELMTTDVRTPGIAFTHPSCEWDEETNSPPFALKVTPSESMASLYNDEQCSLPQITQVYDPAWPIHDIRSAIATPEYNPPASGQEYDPAHEIAVYSSPESSSPTFPFATDQQQITKDISSPKAKTPSPISPLSPHQSPYSPSTYLPSSPPTISPLLTPPFCPVKASEFDGAIVLPLATALLSPLTSIPILKPLRSSLAQAASQSQYTVPNPPHHFDSSSKTSPSLPPKSTKCTGQSPSSGISKTKPRSIIAGPRPSPPRDLRRSVQSMRRMNSDLDVDSEGGGRRYLRLGRESSPTLPFMFGRQESSNQLDEETDASGGETFDFGFTGAKPEDLDIEMIDIDLTSSDLEQQETERKEQKELKQELETEREIQRQQRHSQPRYRAYSPLRHSTVLTPLREEETPIPSSCTPSQPKSSTHQTAATHPDHSQRPRPPSFHFPCLDTEGIQSYWRNQAASISAATTAGSENSSPTSPTQMLEELLAEAATARGGSVVLDPVCDDNEMVGERVVGAGEEMEQMWKERMVEKVGGEDTRVLTTPRKSKWLMLVTGRGGYASPTVAETPKSVRSLYDQEGFLRT